MEIDKDEDLVYEDLADFEDLTSQKESTIPTAQTEHHPSSTGSISDDEEDKIRESLTTRTRTIVWSNDEVQRDRPVLVPRRSNDFPLSSFGIKEPEERGEKATQSLIQALYDGLDVDISNPHVRASSLFVHSLKPISSSYEIQKIFAEFNPTRCALLSPKTAVLKFETEYTAAEALISLTKRLVRIRKETVQEEGEIEDDEDSDTASRQEKFSQIIILHKDGSRKRKQMADTVEVDVDEVEIPKGNWQMIIKHVPKGRYIFVRLANSSEVKRSMIEPYRQEVTEHEEGSNEITDNDIFRGYKKPRVKPGINVFKEDGTELSWNFEHDTRFYEQGMSEEDKSEEPKCESKSEEIVTKSGEKIKSRGRGSKKFMAAIYEDSSD